MSEEILENNGVVEEGAPLWVVTFGDLMSLLLCFFVLLLSFSEIDRQWYKEVAGSMAKAFGIQTKDPAFDTPKGDKIIAKDFDQDTIATREKEEVGKEIQKEIESRFKDIKDLIQVDVEKNKVTIRLMGESTFDSGKAEIRSKLKPLLMKIASAIKGTKGDIIIAGHTDNVPVKGGPYKSNLGLSIARAASVAEYLMQRGSIEPKRVSTMGFGKYRPLESNDIPEGRKKNRRVEITLSSMPSAEKGG